MQSEVLAKVVRGATIESIHRGHLIVVDGAGETLFSLGDPEIVTFWRSSAKAFQAIPFLKSGAAYQFGFSEKEIALACGSHSGEAMHVETVRQMLDKIGLSEADLRCGTHLPFDEKRAEEMVRNNEKPTQLHNNCSGKHAAMLALAKHIGADLNSYEQLENPIQQAILECIAEFSGVPKDELKIGIDGCAAPNFALPISAMAKSFARLVCPPKNFDAETREACRRVVSAMLAHPEMIGGTDRLDTMIMQAGRRKIVSKIGAEGVYSAGVLPSAQYQTGLGIAFKIEDGDDKRARAVVLVELLRHLEILDADALKNISPLAIKNRRGDAVGSVKASFNLKANKEIRRE
ncbi:MAG: asparaginase [Pyrinomonadaceae bacterium]|nr:asparaginase [Pyrinomonadaceae bacterium]